MRLKAFIWDLDGTLLDSYGTIVSSLAEVARENRAPDSEDVILRAVKQGAVSAYIRDLSRQCGTDGESLYRRYREVSNARDGGITLIPGAEKTLEALRNAGAKHFVYTHRGRTTGALLDRLNLKRFFTEVVTSENGFPPKPSGEGVAYLVEKYGLDRARTAYIGDRALDVYCAKNAGVKAILYLPADACVTPTGTEDRIIGRLEELETG